MFAPSHAQYISRYCFWLSRTFLSSPSPAICPTCHPLGTQSPRPTCFKYIPVRFVGLSLATSQCISSYTRRIDCVAAPDGFWSCGCDANSLCLHRAPKEDVPAEDKKLSKQRLQDFQNDECNTRLTGLSQGVASAPRQTPDLDDILAPLQQLKPS